MLRLPPFPWRLPLVALAAWLLMRAVPATWWPPGLGVWFGTLDDLLVTYAGLRIAVWLLADLPSTLGLWRQPPRILRDLCVLLIGTALTVVIVQQQVRINLVSLVTASAVLTAVIGLAAQETLKDLFAGITLQLDPPFRLGDWIALGETRGVVTSCTLMNTELATQEGSRVILPNSFVAAEQLRRFRPEDPLGVRFSIGLDYAFPPAQALDLLRRVLHNNAHVLRQPQPQVWLESYGESAVIYELLAYQAGSQSYAMRDLRSALLLEIWYALQREGQSIPFPVRILQPVRRHSSGTADQTSLVSLEQRLSCLNRNVLFAGLRPQQREQLARTSVTATYAPGEAVVVEGSSDDDDLYQVMSGTLEVIRGGTDGEPGIVVTTLGAGDLFGEMSLLLDAPRSATVRACDEVQLLQVSRASLAPLLEADPALFEQLAAVVDRRRRELERLSADQSKDGDSDILSRMKQLFSALLP